MKITKNYTFWLFLIAPFLALSQAVSTKEVFPNGDNEITIIFDVKQAKDNRAKGLLGKTDDVFLWSGAGTSENGNAFEFTPAGQTNFAAPFVAGKMTFVGNDVWSIKIKPRTYFNVPANQPIKRLGLLLKNGDGKIQTEDFFLPLFDDKLNLKIIEPNFSKVYSQGEKVKIRAFTSKKADKIGIEFVGETPVNLINIDSVNYDFTINKSPQKIIITAQSGIEIISQNFTLLVKPTVETANLPSNIHDGINYLNNNSVIFSFFAPQKQFIHLIGDFNDWLVDNKFLMKQTPDKQRFWLQIDNLEKGREYAFQYLIDGSIAVGDPYCEKILDPNHDKNIPQSNYPNLKTYPTQNSYGGTVSVLQTAQTVYNWKINNFKRPEKENLVIYELLIRDFIQSRKYRDVADSIGYFKRLGINAIELMPVNEFSANESWGYNPTYYMAPDKAYGTKDDLKYLIDKCHENGIAVIMDVVFNHADYEFPYVKSYWDGAQPSKESPFLNPKATHPFSVFFDFNHESTATQNYFDRVLEFWLKEYKIDGYRFDLSKGFTQNFTDPNVDLWGKIDANRMNIWKRFYDKIRTYDKDCYLILEHFAENAEEVELSSYGFMLWGNLNGNFRSVGKGNTASFDWLNYQRRGWSASNLVGYMESHDEERLMYDVLKNGKSTQNYDLKNTATALDRMKALAAIFFSYPGPKMIWQFGEFGYDVNIDFNGRVGNKPLKWEYLKEKDRLNLYKVYAELIKLKTTNPIFKTKDFTESSSLSVKKTTLISPNLTLQVVANFDVDIKEETLNLNAGKWYDYFTGKELNFTENNPKIYLQAGEFHILTNQKLPTPEQGLVSWTDSFTKPFVVSNEKNETDFLIFPNPTIDLLKLKIGTNGGEIIVENLYGQRIYATETKNNEFDLDLSGFSAGTYLVKVVSENKVKVKKVVRK